ncbi:amidohydrolase family protein [Pseudofrankia inefficax]|uniref:Amidohydrolase 2 n=1 Tax=Pseudofrankia inefficax (strain DSM 45817 / CECT 9037 / DDB 130130 / EuI1c) TaxID=298654 RepID=E3J7W3_PSEI1|nr:amidohydrolase family protein [Pseudofrankia inefficax]ADP80867.1 amidohydrolase 2 [Pseudofrankia inefficax]
MATGEDSLGPAFLTPLGTDEYVPPPRTATQLHASATAAETGADAAERTQAPIQRYWAGRRGTAAGLLALNEAAGDAFYEVPAEAALDDAAAEEAFVSDGPVIDVQTHWVASRPSLRTFQDHVLGSYRHLGPDWWTGLEGVTAFTMAEYLRCVFVESETALAVISSTPGTTEGEMLLTNREMAGMRELFDRMAGSGRLLNHTVVRPNMGEIDRMHDWTAAYRPSGWKVYTLGQMSDQYVGYDQDFAWRLDDDQTGRPFLEQVRATGVNLVCAHKGVSGLVASGSPSDVGPAARDFPDINFVVYHSGYEPGLGEVPFTAEAADIGVNRLIESVRGAGLGPGANVYAELGTTWFCLVSRPVEAAHVLGKLLLHLGEDNIVWGTDAIWYGPTQPVLDAFRKFQIPDAMCERYGYPKLTAKAKRKIVAGNAARLYKVDLAGLADKVKNENVLGWTKGVLETFDRHGLVTGR